MYFSNQKKTSVNQKSHICPKCNFENNTAAAYCEICFYPLTDAALSSKISSSVESLPQSDSSQDEQEYPENWHKSTIVAVLALIIAIVLGIIYFFSHRTTPSSASGDRIDLHDSMDEIKNVPSGLFSYAGASYSVSMVTNGFNQAVMQNHPDFHLRYTKPTNQDRSYANGIKMLLDGKLSFVFNGRSLTEEEYSQASLQGIKLQQIPIALDGIALFGNDGNQIDRLSIEQVRGIFTGQITNWEQVGGADLPIVPILLTPENVEILGIEDIPSVPYLTQYAPNYTLAVRKVIAIPGAISFASASLVQGQQQIKVFALADENSANYIAALVGGKPNLALFKNGSYPLTRRLFIVIRQDGTPEQLAGQAYTQMLLSNQGQRIIEKSGFVPLYGNSE